MKKVSLKTGRYSPADAVFRHFPVRACGSVPEIPGLDNILLERTGNLPLVVVVRRWGRGDVTTRQHLSGVCENLGSPPLQLSILGGWDATDEWLA